MVPKIHLFATNAVDPPVTLFISEGHREGPEGLGFEYSCSWIMFPDEEFIE